MTDQETQPPAAWRYCGNQLKLWRKEAGISRSELGEATSYSEESIGSFELGRRRPSAQLLAIADDMCRAGGKLKAATQYLEPERFPPRAREFMSREADAMVLQTYETLLIPGLLQTEAYVRALFHAHYPPLDDETIEHRAAARLERQRIMVERPTAYFAFVIEEIALRRPVGGPDVMRDQLVHLLDVGSLRNVDLQVMPTRQGAHAALNGPIVLLETLDHERLAYEEGHVCSALHSDADRVSTLTQRLSRIRTQALNTEQTVKLITEVANSW